MPHPTFGNDMVGEVADRSKFAAQDGHFQAALVVEMDMQGCNGELVMGVEGIRQPLGKLATRVIVNVDQRGDAVLIGPGLHGRLLKPDAGEVANCLGPVLVTPRRDQQIDSAMSSSSIVIVTRCMA